MDRLEAELSSMRPREVSAELQERISARLAATRRRPSWADRCLLSAMSMGGIAASVIVGLLVFQTGAEPPRSPPPPGGSVMLASAEHEPSPRFGDYPLLIARADSALITRSARGAGFP